MQPLSHLPVEKPKITVSVRSRTYSHVFDESSI